MSNLAISYARFSSAPQGEGHSLTRQLEAAEAYATANSLVIDRGLSFRDLGVSAWDRSNIQKGALGLFLKAVEGGKVPVGSTFIVESFDRLSRATPRQALSIFTRLLDAGLNVVTLTDPPKRFSAASVDANMFELFEALMQMHRAHGESERKSQLLASSWEARRNRAMSDGTVMTSKAPLWIKAEGPPKDKTYALIPERAAVVKRVVDMALAGTGNHTIIKSLIADGVPSWPRSDKEDAKRQAKGLTHTWEPSYIQKMLTHPALWGAVVVKGGAEVYPYYPPILTKDEFILLQSRRSVRATRKTTNRKGNDVTNLFSGLLFCGYCGSRTTISGYTSQRTKIQTKYFACHGARTGSSTCRMHAWEIKDLEPALLFWLTQVDYGKLVGTRGRSDIDLERQQLAVLEKQATVLREAITNGNIAIEQGLLAMIQRVKDNETELARIEKLIDTQQRKVNTLATQEGGGASRMKDLIGLFKALKTTTEEVPRRALREQLSAAINLVVERIELHPMGRNARGTKEDRFADVMFKNGANRRIEAGEC